MLGSFPSPPLTQVCTIDSVITCEHFWCLFGPNMLSLWLPLYASSMLSNILTTLCLGSSAPRSSFHVLETIYSLPQGAVIITANQQIACYQWKKACCYATRLCGVSFYFKAHWIYSWKRA